jgi:Histidine kinase
VNRGVRFGERLKTSVNCSGNASTRWVGPSNLVSVIRHLVLLLIVMLCVRGEAPAAEKAVPRQRHGDDPRWAARDWDDSDWVLGNNVPTRAGIYWMRFRVTSQSAERPHFLSDAPMRDLSGLGDGAPIDSIFMASPYSYELYWDGQLIGRSGVVGRTPEEEKTDRLDHLFVIPRELLGQGEHVVAIRMSSFHYNFPAASFAVGFLLSNYARHYAGEMLRPVFPLIGTGGALLVALISAVLFWAVDRRRTLLLCSLVSFALAVFYLLIAWRWLHNDPYEWFYPRLLTITLVMTFIAGVFPWLLLEQFALPRRAWWLAATLPLLGTAWITSPIYEVKALWMCRAMLAMSLGIAVLAVWRRRTGAWFVFIGALVGLLVVRADRRDFLDPSFFATFSALVLYIFTMLGLQLRADRQRAQVALLTTARLETELLKKNLQPHFLLNTLTALSEVIEQNPSMAVRLIDDLSEEFRSLARMSGEKLVPLTQELDLCAAHLRVMACRMGRNLSLENVDVDRTVSVPPALFLTLIENGLVHQQSSGRAVFRLQMLRMTAATRFIFLSPGATRPRDDRSLGGTGLKYVKARLEESFPGQWSFSHGAVADGWETVIDLIKVHHHGGAA